MSDRPQVESIISCFLNADDVNVIPLSENVEYFAIMTPEPICGESAVREHLRQITPFVSSVKQGEMIIEGGSVAVLAEIETINGVITEGAYFLEVTDGKISRVKAVFDTHSLLTGRKR